MCIFVVSTNHSEFPFVLLDNRDELFQRPTAAAHWWQENNNIYSPQDLEREEKGTWIGVSRNGRVCVLVNFFEEERGSEVSKISRGALPKQFLESSLSPRDWVDTIKNKHRDDLSSCGGFTLLAAQVFPQSSTSDANVVIEFLTNRNTKLPGVELKGTFSLSNGPMDDTSWIKTARATKLFDQLLREKDPHKLTEKGLQLLSTSDGDVPQSRVELRRHIFIPQVSFYGNSPYGTRCQTAIVVDKLGNVYYTEVDIKSGANNTEKFCICR